MIKKKWKREINFILPHKERKIISNLNVVQFFHAPLNTRSGQSIRNWNKTPTSTSSRTHTVNKTDVSSARLKDLPLSMLRTLTIPFFATSSRSAVFRKLRSIRKSCLSFCLTSSTTSETTDGRISRQNQKLLQPRRSIVKDKRWRYSSITA